ncbi:MAG TPA: hypothetical protein PK037_10070, partial [Saprospiraceae bacterium]|nr:hypothetical protein [Saprospiraceae bacterium]
APGRHSKTCKKFYKIIIMNINKSNVIKYWYLSLPAFVIAVAGLYCLGFHFGQWLYTANH